MSGWVGERERTYAGSGGADLGERRSGRIGTRERTDGERGADGGECGADGGERERTGGGRVGRGGERERTGGERGCGREGTRRYAWERGTDGTSRTGIYKWRGPLIWPIPLLLGAQTNPPLTKSAG